MGMFDPNITWFVGGQEIDPASRSMQHPNPAFRGKNLRRDVYSNMWRNTTGYGSSVEQVPKLDWLQNYAEQNNIPININQLNPENPNDRQVLDAWNKNQSYYRTLNYRNKREEAAKRYQQAMSQAGIPLQLLQNPAAMQQIQQRISPYTNRFKPLFGRADGTSQDFRRQNLGMFGQAASTGVPQTGGLTPVANQQPTPVTQPNTMLSQTSASTSVTQNNLLNALTNKIKSQRAAVLKNLFGM